MTDDSGGHAAAAEAVRLATEVTVWVQGLFRPTELEIGLVEESTKDLYGEV